jgi:7,8-dihydroneopterin 2',3'-cyclic phosphate phosphodiesterase
MVDSNVLNPRLKKLVNKIIDKPLRRKTADLLDNPTFELDGTVYSGMPLDVAPAGKSHHHCYPGGYVEHIVSASKIALTLCDCVEEVYHGKVNRDLVIAGMLVHDLFKPPTYSINRDGSYGSTSLAESLDHLSIATAELIRRKFPLQVVHIVASHHGEYGPIRPRTVEALICHLADLTDSRLNGEVLNAAAYLTRRTTGQELNVMTSKEAFEIVHAKAIKGWKGVDKTLERISRRRATRKA